MFDQQTRPPLERMLRIHAELARGSLPNCTKLGAALEVSRKTVVRDLAFMRDRLDLPIEYDPRIQAYLYTHPVTSFPTVQISEGELLALLVAQRALQQFQGTPFYGQLAQAFEKLTAGLQDRISFAPADELQAVSFKNVGFGKTDLVVFNALSRAVLRQQAVEFSYRKIGEQTAENRRIHPYHLAHRENLWYLVGLDVARGALRTFALTRIRSVRTESELFVRPSDFSPEQFFASALGVLRGDGNHVIKIRFTPEVADHIQERAWHDSQTIEPANDGSIVLTLTLGAFAEVERWILGWGAEAEVLQPMELRARIAQAAGRTKALYCQPGET